MSNPLNQFKQGFTYEEWVALWGTWVQGKVDKRGGVVPAEGSNTRAGAQWFNLVDDLMKAVADGSIGSNSFEYISNTDSPQTFSAIPQQDEEIIEVNVTTDRNMLELTWFSVMNVADSTFSDMTITIAQDAAFANVIVETPLSQITSSTPLAGGQSGFKGNTLMMGVRAEAPFSPSAGVLRFYVKLSNTGQVGNSPVYIFGYVVKAFDLTLTEMPVFTPP